MNINPSASSKKPSLTKDDLDHLRVAREFEALVATEGWKIYQKILQEHLDIKERELFKISQSFDEMVASNAVKGAVMTFRLCRDIVPNIIKIAQEIRSTRSSENEEW